MFLTNNKLYTLNLTIIICLMAISGLINGQANYYFSSSIGDDSRTNKQAQNPSTPWQTITKLNTFFENISPGDSILFKRGDTFYGSVIVNQSGLSGKPITISAYGEGTKPLISGFSTISSWTSLGNNIYESVVPYNRETVNCVVVNGILQPVGRYPKVTDTNGGYLVFESHTGHGQITDNQLTDIPVWTGGEIVIRKNDWVIDKTYITSHSGKIINFMPVSTFYHLQDGSGYFIQNHPSTLTQDGDWCYDSISNKIKIYYQGAPPEIKVSTLDELLTILPSNDYIKISDISFEGANTKAVYANNLVSISINSCDINFSGTEAVHLIQVSGNVQFNDNIVSNSLNNAVTIYSSLIDRDQINRNSFCTIRNNSIINSGMIPGMGGKGDGKYMGMYINSENGAIVEYNIIKNTGYIPLRFRGNNILIKNNIIDSFLLVKMDGGGIYAYNGGNPVKQYSNRVIRGNIVSNGFGNPYGTRRTASAATGIYMDNNVNHVEIVDNIVFNMTGIGSQNNSPSSISMKRNTFFNVERCFVFDRWVNDGSNRTNGGQDITDLDIQNNIIFATSAKQTAWTYRDRGIHFPAESSIQERISSMGIINNNYYHLLNEQGFVYLYRNNRESAMVYPPAITFDNWKSLTGYEKNGIIIPSLHSYHLNVITTEDLNSDGQLFINKPDAKTNYPSDDHVRFDVNSTNTSLKINLDGKYVTVDGKIYSDTYILEPYSSVILIKNSDNIPSAIAE